MLKEDYYINLCKKAINLVNEARGADEKERQEQGRKAKISEILHRGNQPRFCICCGEIVVSELILYLTRTGTHSDLFK